MFPKALFALLLIGFQQSACCEDTLSKPTKHELGFNTTLLIKQVLSFNPSNIPFSPYMVTYKYTLGKQTNLRAGAGITVQKTSSTENDINKRHSKFYSMDYRLGAEIQKMLTQRWKAYYGIDVVYMYNETFTEFQFNTFSSQTKGYGIGPVAGIQCYLTKRLSLFTETTLYFTNTDERIKNTSSSPFGQNSSSHSNILRGDIKLPTTLYLAFKL